MKYTMLFCSKRKEIKNFYFFVFIEIEQFLFIISKAYISLLVLCTSLLVLSCFRTAYNRLNYILRPKSLKFYSILNVDIC